MPVVWIPALMRDLTGGAEQVHVPGTTVGEAIAELEMCFPGTMARLCEAGRLRANFVVVVNGTVSRMRLRQKLDEDSEVHFVPQVSGGQESIR